MCLLVCALRSLFFSLLFLSQYSVALYAVLCPCILSLCSVHWEEPVVQYRGDIIEYEIYLGQRALELDEQPDEETRKNINIDENDVRS